MGQYFRVVNKTKKEYVSPWDIGGGAKLWEWCANHTAGIFPYHMCPLKLRPLSYHNLHHHHWSLCVQGAGVSSRAVGLRQTAVGASWGLCRYV